MKKSTLKIMPMLVFASAAATLAGCNNEHVHTFAAEWSTNETEHWHAATCKHTDEKEDLGAHVYDNDSDATCNTCGYEREIHTHTFATEWSSNETEHWHAATCEHTDEKEGLAAHTFNDGVVSKEATYEEDGEKTYTCTVCGKTKVDTIPALVAFFMPIDEVYSVSGKVVVFGTIYSGTVKVGDDLTLSNVNTNVKITVIKKDNKDSDNATVGDYVSLALEGVTKDQVKRGYSLFTPSSKKYYNQVKVNLTSYTEAEGGKHAPFISKTKFVTKLYPSVSNGNTVYAAEVMGCVILPTDLEIFMPSETHEVTIILETPFILNTGMELLLIEGTKKIAHGTISALEEHNHDTNYDENGVCGICGLDQYLSFNYDAGYKNYSYVTNLEVNGKIFLKITPDSGDENQEWRVDIEGATADKYEIVIYDSNFNEVSSDMLTGSTYYIVIVGTDNVNDVTIKVVDSNNM